MIFDNLKNKISIYRKSMISNEKNRYKKQFVVWHKINDKKKKREKITKFMTSNDNNKIKFFNYVLRMFANFSYLIHFLYDENDFEISNAFIAKNLKNKRNLFMKNLNVILRNSFKYQQLLLIVQKKKNRIINTTNSSLKLSFSWHLFLLWRYVYYFVIQKY